MEVLHRLTFASHSYILNKKYIARAKNHGVSLDCAICHEPVSEGQEVRVTSGRNTRFRHKACFEAGLIG